MTDAELEKIKKSIKRLKILICSDNSTDKTSWKKFFVDLGAPVGNFTNVTTFDEANEALEDKPDIFFVSHRINGVVGLSLVEKHIRMVPDRRRAWSFVCTDNNSMALSAHLAEKNIDALILKPYNPNDLNQALLPALENKIEMGKSTECFYEILGLIRSEELDQAQTKIDSFQDSHSENPYPYYLRGLLLEEKNNLDEAVDSYYKALERDEKNYHVLVHLFDILIAKKDYDSAYPCGEVICENYPIDPERIPDMIRASLATKNFQNLLSFCEAVLNVEGDIGGISKPIAAALILTAKHLASNKSNRDTVIEAVRRGVGLTDHNGPIFITALETLLKVENLKDTKKLLDEIPSDEMDEDLLFIDLHYSYLEFGPDNAFNKAQELIKIDRANEKAIELMLKAGKEVGKPQDKLEDMAYDAAKVFPELKDHFLSLIN